MNDDTATLRAQLAQTQQEKEHLKAHILDIAAHATPNGDIPGEPGWVGVYLLTAGALHRALGTIGHTAPSCDAEAQLAQALTERDEANEAYQWARETREELEKRVATLEAQLAAERAVREQYDETILQLGGCLCDPPGSGEEYCRGTCAALLLAERARLLEGIEDIATKAHLSADPYCWDYAEMLTALVNGTYQTAPGAPE